MDYSHPVSASHALEYRSVEAHLASPEAPHDEFEGFQEQLHAPGSAPHDPLRGFVPVTSVEREGELSAPRVADVAALQQQRMLAELAPSGARQASLPQTTSFDRFLAQLQLPESLAEFETELLASVAGEVSPQPSAHKPRLNAVDQEQKIKKQNRDAQTRLRARTKERLTEANERADAAEAKCAKLEAEVVSLRNANLVLQELVFGSKE